MNIPLHHIRCSLLASLLFLCPGTCLAAETSELEGRLASAAGEERVDLLNELAFEVKENEPGRTVDLAAKALELARDLDYVEGQATALNNLGIGHYFISDYARALDFYSDCLELSERSGNRLRSAGTLNNIGIIHFLWGEYDSALEYYYRSLKIQESLGDEEGVAKAYNNLGNVYDATEEFEESLRYYGEAIRLYEKLDLQPLVASTLSNIGLAQVGLGRYDEALASMARALEIEEELGDRTGMGYSLNHMGTVYEALGDDRAARDSYERALALRIAIGDRKGEADTRKNIGSIHAQTGDLERAVRYLDEALAVASEINVREIMRDTHLSLSEVYEQAGRHEQALEHYKQFKEINDGIFNESSSRKMAELQTRYEVEKKDRQIENLERKREAQRVIRNIILVTLVLAIIILFLLYRGYRLKVHANREIEGKNRALERVHAELEEAARNELAHVARVATMGELSAAFVHELRQPLTAIHQNARASQRFLEAEPPNTGEVDGALADIVESTGRADAIITRLRALMRRGEIRLEAVDLNEAIRGIEPIMRADNMAKGVSLQLTLAPDLPAVEGDRIQLQQVVLNLVRNGAAAMERGDGSEPLRLTTSVGGGDDILVRVRDAGPPIGDEVLEQMFEPFYTTREEGLGMGLPICRTIIKAHGGRLWAERNADRGLTVNFTLPLEGADDD
jgi:signal transduction histidine kinase/Tfp pilus assembly protein PilF